MKLFERFYKELVQPNEEFKHYLFTYTRYYNLHSFFIEMLKRKAEKLFTKLVIYLPEGGDYNKNY